MFQEEIHSQIFIANHVVVHDSEVAHARQNKVLQSFDPNNSRAAIEQQDMSIFQSLLAACCPQSQLTIILFFFGSGTMKRRWSDGTHDGCRDAYADLQAWWWKVSNSYRSASTTPHAPTDRQACEARHRCREAGCPWRSNGGPVEQNVLFQTPPPAAELLRDFQLQHGPEHVSMFTVL